MMHTLRQCVMAMAWGLLVYIPFLLSGCAASKRPDYYGKTSIRAVTVKPIEKLEGKDKISIERSLASDLQKTTFVFAPKWTEKRITILRPNQPPLKIKASYNKARSKSSSYTSSTPVLAFVIPDTGNIWIGPEYPCYVETSEGLFAVHVDPNVKDMFWTECAIVKEYAFKIPPFDDLLERFKKDAVRYYKVSQWPSFYFEVKAARTQTPGFTKNSQPVLDAEPLFFDDAVMSGNMLQYSVRSSLARQVDTYFIDVNTREAVRFTRNGRQLFP